MSTLRDEMEEMIVVRQSLGFDGNSTIEHHFIRSSISQINQNI